MAPYLRWLLGLVFALAFTVILVASIDEPRLVGGRKTTPERAREQALANEEMNLQVELSQLMRRDSLLAVLPASGPPIFRVHPDLKVTVDRPIDVPVTAELGTLTDPRARIGVFVVDEAYGLHRTTATPYHNVEYFAGEDASGPYCIVAGLGQRTQHPGTYNVNDGALHFGFGRQPEFWTNWGEQLGWINHVLGPCGYWGRYGKPGPGIDAWLNAGGYYFANAPAYWLVPATRQQTPEEAFFWFDRDLLRARGCRAGRRAECLRLTLTPWPRSFARLHAPVANLVSDNEGQSPVFGRGDAALLAHLEQEFGRERFARFWQSAAPVEASFEAAFGIPMDEWVTGWVQKYIGAVAAGPGLELSNFALSLLTIAVLLALSLRLGQNRVVGGDSS